MTEQHLDQLAKEAVTRYTTDKMALNDVATDIATRENMDPEHIKRLVEAVNTEAFKNKFDNPTEGATDRMVEFETASPHAVISRMLTEAKDAIEALPGNASEYDDDMTSSLPNTREYKADEMLPDQPPGKTSEERPVKKHIVAGRLHKTAEDLHSKKLAERNTFTDATQALLDCFRRAGASSFEEFEKSAFYHLGEEVAPYLQVLRQSLGKPSAEYDHVASVKIARVVDMETKEMKLLKSALTSYNTITKYAQALRTVEKQIARLT
jgi:hypothetical protein